MLEKLGSLLFGTRLPRKRQRLRNLGVYMGEHRILTTTAFGHRIFLDTRDLSLTPTILDTGRWEDKTTATLLRVLRPGQTIVEVGANFGFFTLLMADRVGPKGHVHAFEANPATHQLLWQSVEMNGFRSRVTTLDQAAHHETGTVTFSQFERYIGGSHVGPTLTDEYRAAFHDDVTHIEVPAVRLDDYLEQRTIRPDLIRLDAEGSEAAILSGAKRLLDRGDRLMIVAEFCPLMVQTAGQDPAAFLRTMQDQGFSVRECSLRGPQPVSVDSLLQRPEAVSDLIFVRG